MLVESQRKHKLSSLDRAWRGVRIWAVSRPRGSRQAPTAALRQEAMSYWAGSPSSLTLGVSAPSGITVP